VAETPPGEWVIGFKYDDTKLERTPLNRRDLDAVAPNHPVVVGTGASYLRLQQQGFREGGDHREDTRSRRGQVLPGGGELTGLAAEHANDVFSKIIPGEARGPSARRASPSSPSS